MGRNVVPADPKTHGPFQPRSSPAACGDLDQDLAEENPHMAFANRARVDQTVKGPVVCDTVAALLAEALAAFAAVTNYQDLLIQLDAEPKARLVVEQEVACVLQRIVTVQSHTPCVTE